MAKFKFWVKLQIRFFDRTIRKVRNWNQKWVLIGGTPCTHLSKQGERYQLQYTSVNPLETDTDIFIDARFSKKCMTYGRILEKYWF